MTTGVRAVTPYGCASRLKVYKAFKEGQKRILVATDLVGRGIDIERVNIVINYDMPETDERHGNGADTYLHRVSRTSLAPLETGSALGLSVALPICVMFLTRLRLWEMHRHVLFRRLWKPVEAVLLGSLIKCMCVCKKMVRE